MSLSSVSERIQQFNQGRRPDSLLVKYAKLRKNAFIFFRGTAHLFYQYATPPAAVAGAPTVAITGDLHLENFGAYIGDNGLACFSVNDFDEALLAPVAWDLVRFIASLFVGLAVLHRPSDEADFLVDAFLQDYIRTLMAGGARLADPAAMAGPIGEILRAFPSRGTPGFSGEGAEPLVSGGKITVDRKRFLSIDDAERVAMVQLFAEYARQRPDTANARVLDVARLVAGTSSLGLDRYVVLTEGRGEADGSGLLEMKEVRVSCALPYLNGPPQSFPSQAARVVDAQRLFQDVPPARLEFVGTAERSLIVRDYSRARDRLNLTDTGVTEHLLAPTVRTMAQVTANGHLRGSAAPEASGATVLQAFAREHDWKTDLISFARISAAHSQADYADYCADFDRGELTVR